MAELTYTTGVIALLCWVRAFYFHWRTLTLTHQIYEARWGRSIAWCRAYDAENAAKAIEAAIEDSALNAHPDVVAAFQLAHGFAKRDRDIRRHLSK